jgi:hypothetical protein
VLAAKQAALTAKQQRSERLRVAHLASVAHRAGDEVRKVAEVAFINVLTSEDRKLSLQQRLEGGGWLPGWPPGWLPYLVGRGGGGWGGCLGMVRGVLWRAVAWAWDVPAGGEWAGGGWVVSHLVSLGRWQGCCGCTPRHAVRALGCTPLC